MKTIFVLLFVLLLACPTYSQKYISLDTNNARALISNDGSLFASDPNSSAGYEFPKDSNSFVLFSSGIWVGAKDPNGSLHLTASLYGGDFAPGPIANDYNSVYYHTFYDSSLWKVTKEEIDYHIANYNQLGYITPSNISNWPANGFVSYGIANDLAPYFDHNNNGMYDPDNGDYPLIKGDEAIFVILNDENSPVDENLISDNLGIEIHLMYYQFNTNISAVNNSTFVNMKIINRRTTNYTDLIMGTWSDFDIGNPQNDFVGSDSIRAIGYIYNGEANDNGGSGQSGFGSNPPACGIKLLNTPIGTAISSTNSGGVQGNPSSPSTYYLYLQGLWADGSPITYGGTGYGGISPTNCMFTGNPHLGTGWNQASLGFPPNDVRIIVATEKYNLAPQEELCFDLVLISSNEGDSAYANVNSLLLASDEVQSFYDTEIDHCANSQFASSEEYFSGVNIYPNPTTGKVFIESELAGSLSIYNLNGQQVYTDVISPGQELLDLDLVPGVYLIELINDFGKQRSKLIIR